MEFDVHIIVSVLTGLATAIPLIISLVKYVQKAIKERNWANLLKLINNLIAEAETMFQTGVERKTWVLSMVQASASTINYDVDIAIVSDLIKTIVAHS